MEIPAYTLLTNSDCMKQTLSAMAACTLLFFTSCEKNTSVEYGDLIADPAPALQAASNLSNCKDCSYSPVCSGSEYKYSDTSAGTVPIMQQYTLQYLKDTIITGRRYQKIKAAGEQVCYYNCSSGMSTSITLNSSGPMIKTTNLKANQPVGHTWSEQITDVFGQANIHNYTIMAKGISRTVAGKLYSDVIYIHDRTSLSMAGLGLVPVSRTDSYFAKGVGLIETKRLDEVSGLKVFHRVLLNATIP